MPSFSPSSLKSSSANDGEVQSLFDTACDADGLMQKSDMLKMEEIAELLDEEELKWEEFEAFWDRAPKFPTDSDKIDVDRWAGAGAKRQHES